MQALEEAAVLRGEVQELRAELAALKALVATGAAPAPSATAATDSADAAGAAAPAAAATPTPAPGDAAAAAAAAATASLAADLQRYKDRFAEHEAKSANLSKRVEVETRALREGLRRVAEDSAPVAAAVATLRADCATALARADAQAAGNDAAHAEIVRQILALPGIMSTWLISLCVRERLQLHHTPCSFTGSASVARLAAGTRHEAGHHASGSQRAASGSRQGRRRRGRSRWQECACNAQACVGESSEIGPGASAGPRNGESTGEKQSDKAGSCGRSCRGAEQEARGVGGHWRR